MDECIICFELMDNNCSVNLFHCNHKDNMHMCCIYELETCPICRAPRKNNVYINIIIIPETQRQKCWLVFCIILYIIIIVSVLDGYELLKEKIIMSNQTYIMENI